MAASHFDVFPQSITRHDLEKTTYVPDPLISYSVVESDTLNSDSTFVNDISFESNEMSTKCQNSGTDRNTSQTAIKNYNYLDNL